MVDDDGHELKVISIFDTKKDKCIIIHSCRKAHDILNFVSYLFFRCIHGVKKLWVLTCHKLATFPIK